MKITKLLTQQLTRIGLAAVLVSTLNLQLSTARAQGTGFTYQGVLNDGGAPATGLYDLEFRAFDAVSGGAQQAGTVIANDVPVTNGLFTTTLDFGAAVFTGPARWLNIAVRPGASVGAYANMLPRQPITASPYAVFAGGSAAAGVTGTLPDARLSANVALRSGGNAFIDSQAIYSGNLSILSENVGFAIDDGGNGPRLGLIKKFGYGPMLAASADAAVVFGHSDQFSVLANIGSATLTEKMRINPNGNVGIGTNDPTSKLEVVGTVKATAFTGSGSGLTALNASQVTSGTLNAAQIPTLDAATKLTGTLPDARLSANVALRAGGNALTGNQTVMSGNVGIGTTSPLAPMEVRNNSGAARLALFSGLGGASFSFYDVNGGGAGGNPYLWDITGDTNALAIAISGVGYPFLIKKSNGYVGINNGTPGSQLEVGGTVTATSFSGSGSGLTALNASQLTSGSVPDARLSANVALRAGGNAFTGQQTVMSGNVGIGTTSPLAPLSFGSGVSNTKLALWEDGLGGAMGLGIQGNQYRLHLNNSSDRFSFLNGPAGTEVMSVRGNGNVGIGTATPGATLDVVGAAGLSFSGYLYASGGPAGAFSGPGSVSIRASGTILALNYVASSDARIKDAIGQSEGSADLKTLLGIKITDYTYKDIVAKGNRPQKKVIAQQVEQVYPQAVTKITDVVPDIYQKATQKDGWVQLATDLKVGERVKLMGEKEEGIHEVLEVKAGAFRTDYKPATEKVFVYGREVKDFRSVDYEAISMLNVSATQELARKLDAQESELTDLRAELSKLRSERTSLAQTVNDMQARFVRLEQAMNKTTAPAVKDVSASADVK